MKSIVLQLMVLCFKLIKTIYFLSVFTTSSFNFFVFLPIAPIKEDIAPIFTNNDVTTDRLPN